MEPEITEESRTQALEKSRLESRYGEISTGVAGTVILVIDSPLESVA